MTQKASKGFERVKAMVRGHLSDADQFSAEPGSRGSPAPAVIQCYASAFATATGAYGGGSISVSEWALLHEEIRSHQSETMAK